MNEFVEKFKDKKPAVSATYILTGEVPRPKTEQRKTSSVKTSRWKVTLCREKDLKKCRDAFTSVNSCNVYSVQMNT